LWCRFPAYGRLCWVGAVSGLVSVTLADDKSHTVNCGNVIYLTKGCSCNLLYHMWGIGDWSLAYHLANPKWPFFSWMIFITSVLFEDFLAHVTKCQPFRLCDGYQLKHFLHRANKNWRAQNLCITCCNWVLNLIIIGPPAGPKKSH
jgi:hypothetical protein